ncbi:sporulation protein [Bacillus halotolerans]|uniref:sporulation protein n=1 Tax=Bacillus halotolerans TaxID=260554 RepID=UPI000D040879|nr:sporulation protein [Bacillus halotolerans]PRS18077.1 sporulation protein [Bacillus halotolerans]QDK68276.1 sporulation protein [Bacillus halotolerans]UTL77578.1 sporulation protein [Bacillus halotolerans]WJE44021.1 sporulation protein [Bacillus halotolerans]WPC81572.1 sporulation protein [Bacillus halotolerans]
MSFFKKLAASAGIGAAKVDTILEKDAYCPGEEVRGTVHVKGGKIAQDIRYIDLQLNTRYVIVKDDEERRKHATIHSFRVTGSFTIQPGEEHQFPFSFILPLDTPITVGKVEVAVVTDLDIQGGIDKSDHDRIFVEAHPWVENVLEAIENLGFRLNEADCEQASYFQRRLPFVQEFEFVPTSGYYRQMLDELELIFLLEEDGLEIIFEVDRRARGLHGWLEEMYNDGEQLVRVRFRQSELDNIEQLEEVLEEIIDQYAE